MATFVNGMFGRRRAVLAAAGRPRAVRATGGGVAAVRAPADRSAAGPGAAAGAVLRGAAGGAGRADRGGAGHAGGPARTAAAGAAEDILDAIARNPAGVYWPGEHRAVRTPRGWFGQLIDVFRSGG